MSTANKPSREKQKDKGKEKKGKPDKSAEKKKDKAKGEKGSLQLMIFFSFTDLL